MSLNSIPVAGTDITSNLVSSGYVKEMPTNPLGTGAYKATTNANGSVSITTPIPPPDIAVGKYIKFGSYNSVPILWRVIYKQDINSDGVQELLLFSDRIITLKAFDSNGDWTDTDSNGSKESGDANRTNSGSNYWEKSNIRAWLKSSAAGGAIDWLGQLSPVWQRLNPGYNAFDAEKGFLADGNFTAGDRSKIIPITHKAVLANVGTAIDADYSKTGGTTNHVASLNINTAVENYETTAFYRDVQDTVFLLNITELYQHVYNNATLLNGSTWYIGKPTAESIVQTTSHGYINGSLSDVAEWQYWLRDANSSTSFDVRMVYSDGIIGSKYAYDDTYGIRPACYISPIITITGTGSAADPYTITGY